MTVTFELDGEQISALNGGPHYTFNEAVSFMVECADQDRWTTTGTRSRKAARRARADG